MCLSDRCDLLMRPEQFTHPHEFKGVELLAQRLKQQI